MLFREGGDWKVSFSVLAILTIFAPQKYKNMSSELILNDDGSIYHLALRPEELADTVILVGDPQRVERVSRHFDKIEITRNHREFVTHTGTMGDKRISVVSTGIGPDNIDIVLNELDALANIDLETRKPHAKLKKLNLIRIGTSGALQENIPLNSVVVSAHAVGLDNMVNFYEREIGELEDEFGDFMMDELPFFPVEPYAASGNKDLVKTFSVLGTQGITVTCPGFYGPQGRILRLELSIDKWLEDLREFKFRNMPITNLEMETAAIYGLAELLGHRAVSLNAILANRFTQEFSTTPQETIDKLIVDALALLK
jgi:uridine phosphorylase